MIFMAITKLQGRILLFDEANSNKDIWFCGSTPYYSIASYVGFDTPREMAGVYGSSYS